MKPDRIAGIDGINGDSIVVDAELEKARDRASF